MSLQPTSSTARVRQMKGAFQVKSQKSPSPVNLEDCAEWSAISMVCRWVSGWTPVRVMFLYQWSKQLSWWRTVTWTAMMSKGAHIILMPTGMCEGTVINLRKVSFGDTELTNVKASVARNLKAPLLLGQSVLSRLGSVEIDNQKQVIRIKPFHLP